MNFGPVRHRNYAISVYILQNERVRTGNSLRLASGGAYSKKKLLTNLQKPPLANAKGRDLVSLFFLFAFSPFVRLKPRNPAIKLALKWQL
jgi:hypothetical protein